MELLVFTLKVDLVGAVDHMTRGSKIADLIAIGGSLDYVVPDIDR